MWDLSYSGVNQVDSKERLNCLNSLHIILTLWTAIVLLKASVSLHNFGKIGSIPLALPYAHMLVICGYAKPIFLTEHATMPLNQSMLLGYSATPNASVSTLVLTTA